MGRCAVSLQELYTPIATSLVPHIFKIRRFTLDNATLRLAIIRYLTMTIWGYNPVIGHESGQEALYAA